jgi:hypothetical protein
MTNAEEFAAPQKRPSPEEDLSEQLCAAVEKQPGDHVKCTLVGNGNYRCNWWAPQATGAYDNPGMGGLLVTTHRVRRSCILRVTRNAGKLVIEEVARR